MFHLFFSFYWIWIRSFPYFFTLASVFSSETSHQVFSPHHLYRRNRRETQSKSPYKPNLPTQQRLFIHDLAFLSYRLEGVYQLLWSGTQSETEARARENCWCSAITEPEGGGDSSYRLPGPRHVPKNVVHMSRFFLLRLRSRSVLAIQSARLLLNCYKTYS